MKSKKRATPIPSVSQTKILRWQLGTRAKKQIDDLAREEPLEIRVRGKSIVVTMRTPGHDHELAAGFLLGEGLISKREDILEIAHCQQNGAGDDQNILNVFVSPSVKINLDKVIRHVYASSSCGLCGKESILSVHQHFSPIQSNFLFPAQNLIFLSKKVEVAQETFHRTGGLHAAAIFNHQAELIALREDVGRHNAVDKVIGHAFLERKFPLDSHILWVSGRASFEIMQKALSAKIPIVAAVSAPSSLAVEFAQESNQTLIGFLRGQTMNIYSCPEKLKSK